MRTLMRCQHCSMTNKFVVVLNQEPWTVEFVDRVSVSDEEASDYGGILYDEKRILIDRNLDDYQRLDTLAHELAHAAFPQVAESIITEYGSALAACMVTDGWRRTCE